MTLRKIIAALFASGYCLTAAAAVVEGGRGGPDDP